MNNPKSSSLQICLVRPNNRLIMAQITIRPNFKLYIFLKENKSIIESFPLSEISEITLCKRNNKLRLQIGVRLVQIIFQNQKKAKDFLKLHKQMCRLRQRENQLVIEKNKRKIFKLCVIINQKPQNVEMTFQANQLTVWQLTQNKTQKL